ncbi:acyl-CoA dehydrogenase [Mycolicibacterium phlei]|uniref:Acyl-CoA dehydrogenase n=1 Tax=Mycolicibacterium phlei DSM 43239 = CCUG 21000 TaxID=1226750 RepID=A0A5N5V068_MYCPH|nr:acyl-CoA dehydrogenase [Mycolicibacterium phlei]VEG07066.1 acyl-CoA dehydrogenase [Mycobacteroides chelonae]AMO58934.1 Acyl-CoA dehydrogenase, short-chain specific [Mycolicibacterium phlei]EID09430.1 acyl-CoA dehydrogenase domain-containing protein [Mycolicibacterium phlei RIVM601174]KAB7754537.1 acyl-CoA dehydrogenase [Mycolicibacterium phlei DSM 43239 = CCUG 21000]KXW59974.1 acyl-CoA dehydrogenase [Mycolicibacterium phlei DSM 43070]
MKSLLLSRRDLDFLLYEWLRVDELTSRDRFADHSRETFDAVLELSEQLATRYFANHNKLNDANEPTFDGEKVTLIPEVKQAWDAFAQADLLAMSMPQRFGGAQLPVTVAQAATAWFFAANVATTGYIMLTAANANLLSRFGTDEQIEAFLKPMLAGRFSGTMALSETQAGSSLADILTRAEPQDDGTYRLFGSKMWISAAEHELTDNIVNLVLAKIPGGPPGTKGISLFIVPKYLPGADGAVGERNDVVLAGLNHKMGQRGITNTVLNFGEGVHTPGGKPGAVGYLVGEPHRGLSYMFTMMNEARLGVGMSAVALGYTGYLKALQYARERPQGRPITAKDPTTPQVPIIEHADVKRMLLAQKAYVEGGLGLLLYCSRLVDVQESAGSAEERDAATVLLDMLTPVGKSWPAQWCLAANDLAIQVHGGYGYTREYDVEQHYRDNRLNPIHEGTHGIQSLDLLGRKVPARGGAGMAALGAEIGRTIADAAALGGEIASQAAQLDATWQRLVAVTGEMFTSGDLEAAMANSAVYLEAFGHIVVAWIWLQQALAAHGRDGDFYDGKRQAARYFFRYELPRTGPQLDLLASLDRTTLEMRDGWF